MKPAASICLIMLCISMLPAFSQGQDDFYDISSVQEINICFSEGHWRKKLDSLFLAGDGKGRLKADVRINGQWFRNAGVRYKGFSSWDASYTKNPFSIFLDHTVKNTNYQGYSAIKLSNVIHDPSFVREALSYEIAGKYMPAPRANFARLRINDTLIGLYSNVESVDAAFLHAHFGHSKNSFFKGKPENLQYPFGHNSNLAYAHGTDTSDYLAYYACESGSGWSDLLRLIYTLNMDTADISSVLHVDRALWMHAFNYTLVNLDSYIAYCQNYYLYLDDNLRFNTIPWDMNMSFGSFRHSDGTMLNLSIAKAKQVNPLNHLNSATFSPRPLTKNLLANTTWRKMFLAHIRTIVHENFRNGEYFLRALEMQNLIDLHVQNDTNKFYSYADFINNATVTAGPGSYPYPGLLDFMQARIAYLDTFPGFSGQPVITNIMHSPQTPKKGDSVLITVRVSGAQKVMLGARHGSGQVFTLSAMFDDGLHHDGVAGDSIYGIAVHCPGNTLQFYIWAENDSAGIFSPERAEYEYYRIQPQPLPTDIVINEIMATKEARPPGMAEEYDGWIELFNNTTENINLSGLYLSDSAAHLSRWALPDTVIPARGFLIIHTAGGSGTNEMQADFRIRNKHGRFFLSYPDAYVVDSVHYSELSTARSLGRYPNGYGGFTFMQPSYAQMNFVSLPPETAFLLYPNPASGTITVELNNHCDITRLEILHVNGSLLHAQTIPQGSDTQSTISTSCDISQLCSGLYIVRIICNDQIMHKKMIVTGSSK